MNATAMRFETAATQPAPAALGDRLADILPAIAASARQTERDRRVPTANVEMLRGIGYFDIVKPAAHGGRPGRFADLVDATIELSSACASTGWVGGLLAAHQWLLAMFPDEAQADVWAGEPGALLCGSYAPTTRAQPVPGGYRLDGRWAFASGCDNAQWSLCAAILPEEGARKPVPAFLLVPRSAWEIEDSWDVVGLVGTGSKTLVLRNVVVPRHRVLTFPQATSGVTPGSKVQAGQGLFAMPLFTGIPSCLAATAVGAAKGALASYLEATAVRVTRGAVAGADNRMAEFATIQLRVADASASVDAAREILLRDAGNAQAQADAGRPFTVADRLVSRRGQAFAVRLAMQAAEALNASTGGLGLQMSNPVQRAWRDANAVGRHISMNWDTVGTMIGQHLLGLEPRGQY